MKLSTTCLTLENQGTAYALYVRMCIKMMHPCFMIIIQCCVCLCTCAHAHVSVCVLCMHEPVCVRACMNLYIYITTVLMPLTHDEDTSLKVSSTSEVVLCFFPRVTLNCSRLYRYTNSVCLTTQHTDIRTCMWDICNLDNFTVIDT